MAASDNSEVFMSKVSRYVTNKAGSNAYWHKINEDLKAIIYNVGPELHYLFSPNTIINNPHIVGWYFIQTRKLYKILALLYS